MHSYDSRKSDRIPEEEKTWPAIFAHLLKDKQRILHPTFVLNGKKVKLDKDEEVFFMGNMRCILSDKGWKFEVPGGIADADGLEKRLRPEPL